MQPSFQPSAQPTCQPSQQPTSQPSTQPSSVPTPIPSQFTNVTEWEERFRREVLNATVDIDTGITQLMYSELLFAYEFNQGGCQNWVDYLRSVEMKTALTVQKVTSVSLSTVKLMYDYYQEHDATPETFVCSDVSLSTEIVNRIAHSDTLNTNITVSCNGTDWKIRNCGGKIASPSICVDCDNPCEVHCSNARDVNFVSSCVVEASGSCIDRFGRRSGLRNYLNILSVTAEERVPAPDILGMSVDATVGEAEVEIMLRNVGGAYCGAFVASKPQPTTLDEIRVQGTIAYSTVANANDGTYNITLNVPNLVAATDYKLYCFSFSSSGAEMSLYRMRKQAIRAFTTDCCKLVTASISSTLLSSSPGNYKSFLGLQVSAAPSADLTASVTISPVAGVQVFFPQVATFTYYTPVNKLQLAIGIDASKLAAGTYTLSIDLSGTSAAEYTVLYDQGITTFEVIAPGATPPTPLLSSAVFSPAGDIITVKFTSPTNRAEMDVRLKSFPCSNLLSFKSSSDAACKWADDSTVVISTPVKANLTSVVGIDRYNQIAAESISTSALVGDVLTLVSGIVKAKCETGSCVSYAYTTTSAVTLSAPSVATKPNFLISAPLIVSKCDEFLLDLTSSSNFGGGLFLNFSVTVQSTTASTASVTAIQSFMQTTYQLNPPTPIPSDLLAKAAEYTFVVRGCNRLTRCSSVFQTVSIANATNPSVVIEGSPYRIINRYQPLVLNAQAYMRVVCGAPPTKRNLQYTWVVRLRNIVQKNILSVTNNPAIFRLAPYSLSVNNVYYIYATALDVNSGYSATTAVSVFVQQANLVARIAGPNLRTANIGVLLRLDASSSYDEDDGLTGVKKSFFYTWSCAQSYPVLSDTCSTSLFTTQETTSGVVTVLPLVANVTATFTVVVSENSAVNRSSIASVTVSTVAATMSNFSIAITPLNSNLNPNFKIYSSRLIISPDEKLKLAGSIRLVQPEGFDNSVYGLRDLIAVWNINDSSIDLTSEGRNAILLTKPRYDILPILTATTVRTGTELVVPFNFALKGNSLVGGNTYLFTLSLRSSVASIVVTVNSPPVPGVLSVTPPTGLELTTEFTLVAYLWQDNDLPLTYKFGYLSSTQKVIALSPKAERTYVVTTLPSLQKSESQYVSITTTVSVFDIFDAASNSTATVGVKSDTVNPLVGESLFALLTTSLNTSVGDVRKTEQIISVFGATLNGVPCGLAPDCDTLHRNPCSSTINTCESCQTNYTGIDGPNNAACVPQNTTSTVFAGQRHLTEQVEQDLLTCALSANCPNAFAECIDGFCVIPQKSCPTNVANTTCSGHGRCVFLNENSNDFVESCPIDNLFCEAKCVCDFHTMTVVDDVGNDENSTESGSNSTSYYGLACQTEEDVYLSNSRTRLLLLQVFANLTQSSNPTAEILSTWSTTVASLSQVAEEITLGALNEILSLFHLTMYAAVDVEASVPVFESLLQCVNSIAALINSAKDFNAYRLGLISAPTTSAVQINYSEEYLAYLESALQAYSAAVANDMLLGQNSIDSILPEVRLSVLVLPMYTTYSTAYSTSNYDTAEAETGFVQLNKRPYYLVDQSNMVSLPLNSLEILYSRGVSSVTIPPIYSMHADDGVTAAVYALKSRLFANAKDFLYDADNTEPYSNLTLQSNPMKVILSSISGRDLNMNCSARSFSRIGVSTGTAQDADRHCEMTVVLQHNVYAPYITPWENVTYTTCFDQDYMVYDYPCLTAPGTNLTVTCPIGGGVMVDRCPIYNLTSVCNSLVNNSNSFGGGSYGGMFNYSSCYVESFTPHNVSCTCRIETDGLLYSDSSSYADSSTDPVTDYRDIEPYMHLSGTARRQLLSRRLAANPQAPRGYSNFSSISAIYVAQPHVYTDTFVLEFRPSEYYKHTYASPIVYTCLISFAGVVIIIALVSYKHDKKVKEESDKLLFGCDDSIVLSKKRVQFDRHVILIPTSKTAQAAKVWANKPTRKVADRTTLTTLKGEISLALAKETKLKHQHHDFKPDGVDGEGEHVGDDAQADDAEVHASPAGPASPSKNKDDAAEAEAEEKQLEDGAAAGAAETDHYERRRFGRRQSHATALMHHGASALTPGAADTTTAEVAVADVKPKRERVLFSKWADLPTAANHRADRETVDVLNATPLDFTLPPMYYREIQKFWSIFWQEMRVYHRWLTVLAHYSAQYSRLYRLISLCYHVLTPLFLMAVMFTMLDEDNGYCPAIHNQRDCIKEPSTLVEGYTKCMWYTNSQTCGFRQPQQTMQTVFYVAFIAAVVSVPIVRFVDFLLIRVAVSSNATAIADMSGLKPVTTSILKKPKVEPNSATEQLIDGESVSELPPPKTVKEYLHRLLFRTKCRDHGAYLYKVCKEVATKYCGSSRRAKIYADMNDMAETAYAAASPAMLAQNKGHLVPVDKMLEMYKAIDPALYKLYPITLYGGKFLKLPAPVWLQRVDFIEDSSVEEEVNLLVSRIQQYAECLLKEGKLEEHDQLLGESNIVQIYALLYLYFAIW